MKKIIILSLLILNLTNCQYVFKKMAGFKNPKLENKHSLMNYLKNNNLELQNNYVCKDKIALKKMVELFYKSVPEALLFDSKGKELIYKESKISCNAALSIIIPKMNSSSLFQKGTLDMQTILNENTISINEDNNSKLVLDTKTEYYLVLNWAIFVGKLNKNHVKVWEQLAKNNKNCKIKIIKINLDLQESWGEDQIK